MTRSRPGAVLLSGFDDIEAGFYDALRPGGLASRISFWAVDMGIVCVHHGRLRLLGRVPVEALQMGGRRWGIKQCPWRSTSLQDV